MGKEGTLPEKGLPSGPSLPKTVAASNPAMVPVGAERGKRIRDSRLSGNGGRGMKDWTAR